MDAEYSHVVKAKKIILTGICLLLLSMAAVIISRYAVLQQVSPTPHVTVSEPRVSKPFHDIKKFQYTRTVDGQRLFSIQADRFRVQKKKMGLMRFGLLREILVDHARIDIFSGNGRPVSLAPIADRETVRRFGAKTAAALVFNQVRIRVLDENRTVLCQILAPQGRIDFTSRQMMFEKGVAIEAGSRQFTAPGNTVINLAGKVQAAQGGTMTETKKDETATVFHTDIFLDKGKLN